MNTLKVSVLLLFIAVTFMACGGLEKRNVDAELIAEMERNCKKVEIKKDYDQAVYVIAYTGKISKERCPLALIRGWKGDRLIEEKQVEICGCKNK